MRKNKKDLREVPWLIVGSRVKFGQFNWAGQAGRGHCGAVSIVFDTCLPFSQRRGTLVGQTRRTTSLHFVLGVTEVPVAGRPAMTNFQRLLLTVLPAAVPEPVGLVSVVAAAATRMV